MTMKAITYTTYGPPDVLQLNEVEKPSPNDDEILVRVRATTATVADVRARGFDIPRSVWLPARVVLGLWAPRKPILGMELAGDVEAVGRGVTRFKVGDEVFGATTASGFGAYAEYACLPEDAAVSIKPSTLSHGETAALPVGARTALHFLRKAGVQPGHKVLVYGASGSVGTYAVQLAKHFGAVVTGVCSTANLDLVESLGADAVIDYTTGAFAALEERFDVVFEAVNKSRFQDCARVLKKGGVYLNVTDPLPSLSMLWTRVTTGKRLLLGQNPSQDAGDLDYLRGLVEAGHLRPVIDRCYPFDQVAEAHRYVETGRKKGNVVLALDATSWREAARRSSLVRTRGLSPV